MEVDQPLYLPHEILIGILSRLLVDSLLRFQRVCKGWYSLVSDPQFVTLHLNQSSKQNDKILLLPTDWSELRFDSIDLKASCNQHQKERFEFPPEIRGSSKVAISFNSCNGLVLLVGCHENLILWNPYTRECIEIAYPHSTKYRYNTRIYGLGYDSLNDDYKLGVIFFTDGTPRFYVIYVFSLRTNRGKKISSYLYWAFGVKAAAVTTVVNGALHWLMIVYDNRKLCKIIGFDLVTENLKELSLPTYLEMWDDDVDYVLEVLSCCLCLVSGVCNDVTKSVIFFD